MEELAGISQRLSSGSPREPTNLLNQITEEESKQPIEEVGRISNRTNRLGASLK